MQGYKNTEDLSTPGGCSSPSPNDPDAKVRQVLAYGALLLAFFTTVIYLVTRDLGVLAESTFVGIIVILVFTYYFSRKKQ